MAFALFSPRRFLLVAAVLLASCAAHGVRTAPPQPPRPKDCGFWTFTSAVPPGFAEIGVIDSGGEVALDEFQSHIGPAVCSLGGEAIIPYANGLGQYIKATVLKRIERHSDGVAVGGPTSSPARDVSSVASGCRFDAQCKGIRICVRGECVDPQPAPSASAAHP